MMAGSQIEIDCLFSAREFSNLFHLCTSVASDGLAVNGGGLVSGRRGERRGRRNRRSEACGPERLPP